MIRRMSDAHRMPPPAPAPVSAPAPTAPIAAAIAREAPPTDLRALLDEVAAAIRDAETEAARTEFVLARDFSLSGDDLSRARSRAADLAFSIRRLRDAEDFLRAG